MAQHNDRPLAGLRVVDSADEKGELCGRILADLGADVIRVEPPGGARSRRQVDDTGGARLFQPVGSLCRLALTVPHAGVEAFQLQEGFVGAAFDDPPLVEHDDFVRVHDGREAMGNDQRCAIGRYAVERSLDFAFGMDIERRCRFGQCRRR